MEKHYDVAGSAAWHARRATCFNAADAPAMAACSSNKSRTQLLCELKSGVSPEFSDYVQERVLDRGHAIEDACRAIAEEIVGEDMAVFAGTLAVAGLSRPLGASFDGITFMEDTLWECKSLNDELRAAMPHAGRDSHTRNDGKALPKDKRIQMEQQLLVSKAERTLFTAASIDRDGVVTEERHAWYYPDPDLRDQIVPGWAQVDRDLVDFVIPTSAPVVVASPMQALPAVVVKVSGEIVIHENFDAFETAARDFLQHRLIREPKTDQDFADLDVQIKAMKGAEAALDAAEEGWIGQIDAVSTAKRRKDMLAKLMRDNRLMAEKLLASEKERRRGEIVADGVKGLNAHVAELNARIGKAYMPTVPADFGGAIKGKKSLASMEDAVSSELARAKIAASATADRIDVNLKYLNAEAGEFLGLFSDLAALVTKDPQDFIALVQFRVADQRAKDEKRAEAQRERIAAEERAKAEAAVRAEQEAQRRAEEAEDLAARQKIIEQERSAQAAIAEARASESMPGPLLDDLSTLAADLRADTVSSIDAKHAIAAAKDSASGPPTLTLGQIGTRLGFALPAAFIEMLGFTPTRSRGAVLFHEEQFPAICEALVGHIYAALEAQPA